MTNRNSKPIVSICRKFASVFIGLVLTLAVLEMGLRLIGVVQGSLSEYSNLQSLKQKNTYRILCLGDSTTQMQYPLFLEQILNSRNVGIRFSVIDKGSGGKDARDIVNRVESYLTKYHPDLVVAMMGNADKGFGPFHDTSLGDIGFFRHSLLYRFVEMRLMQFLEKNKLMGRRGMTGPYSGKRLPPPNMRPHFKQADELQRTPAGKTPPTGGQGMKGGPGPHDADYHGDMAYADAGRIYKEQGKLAEAEASFRKAIEMNPMNGRAYSGLARIYKDQNKFSQAEAAFKKSIEILPENDSAYAGLGELYMNHSMPSQAEDAFEKALELNPKNEYTLIELGSTYRDHGELEKAEALFKKAIEVDFKEEVPERTVRALASLYLEMEKPELAKKYADMAERMGFENYASVTVKNYIRLKEILDKKGIKLACMQYPMRSVDPLKSIFANDQGVIFIDNETIFREAVNRSSYSEYFKDMFGGDFGHCTPKGNRLLAQNIADVILREVFNK